MRLNEVLEISPMGMSRRASRSMHGSAMAMRGKRPLAALGQADLEVPKGYPRNPEEAKAYVKKVGSWLIAEQARFERWARALDKQVTWGLAKCDELKRFNNLSLGFFYYQMNLWNTFRRLGFNRLDPPPRPLVFADKAQTFLEGDITYRVVTTIDCDANGYAQTATALMAPPPSVGPTTSELQGLGGLGVIPVVVVWGAVFVASALAAGGAIALSTWGVSKVIGVFTGTMYTQLDAAQRDKERDHDIARAEFQNACYEKKLAAVSKETRTAITYEKSQELFEECIKQGERTFPTRDKPLGKGDNILKIAAYGGIIVGSIYFLPRLIDAFSVRKSA